MHRLNRLPQDKPMEYPSETTIINFDGKRREGETLYKGSNKNSLSAYEIKSTLK